MYTNDTEEKDLIEGDISTKKRKNRSCIEPNNISLDIQGHVWDSIDYSCSYDSLFTILYNVWLSKDIPSQGTSDEYSTFYSKLVAEWWNMRYSNKSLEDIRDEVRELLHNEASSTFPYGTQGTCVPDLSESIMNNSQRSTDVNTCCEGCRNTTFEERFNNYIRIHLTFPQYPSN